jgi:hypothetical protein
MIAATDGSFQQVLVTANSAKKQYQSLPAMLGRDVLLNPYICTAFHK